MFDPKHFCLFCNGLPSFPLRKQQVMDAIKNGSATLDSYNSYRGFYVATIREFWDDNIQYYIRQYQMYYGQGKDITPKQLHQMLDHLCNSFGAE